MIEFDFYKYQGTGNDFIIIDNRKNGFPKEDVKFINHLCDRNFGIGSDGLMLLEKSSSLDFKMVYFNADGKSGSMCGNGGRCIVQFAKSLGIFNTKTSFEAIGETYHASIDGSIVSIKMNDVKDIEIHPDHLFLDTGSPHHIKFTENVEEINVEQVGREIRYGSPYFEDGTNVNFVEQVEGNTFKVRTYERGVENETLSCGTGVTAVAIASHAVNKSSENIIKLKTLGGILEVSFEMENDSYKNIVLKGPANFVFKGVINY